MDDDEIDLAWIDKCVAKEREKAAAWSRMSWRERLYRGDYYFYLGLLDRRCRWIYSRGASILFESGLCMLGERVMRAVDKRARADGWSRHGDVLSASVTKKYPLGSVIEEIGFLIEDGCLMVRAGHPEPQYKSRAIVERRSASGDPSPEEALEVFRTYLKLDMSRKRNFCSGVGQ